MSAVADTLTGIQIEGNLIAPDITAEMLAGTIKGQAPEDFNFTKTDKLADEIAIAWGDAKAYWAAFQRALARLPENDLATTVTREQLAVPLLRSLGYDPVYTAKAEEVDGQKYALYLHSLQFPLGSSIRVKELEYLTRSLSGVEEVVTLLLNNQSVNLPMPQVYAAPQLKDITIVQVDSLERSQTYYRGTVIEGDD